MGVRSCDWGSSCTVDAAYTYWGNPNGPSPSGGTSLACGAVTVSPFYSSDLDTTTGSGATFAENCDGSPSPDQQLTSAEQNASQVESLQELQCEYEGESTCQAIQSDEQCMSSLITLGIAASEYAFTGTADVVAGFFEFVEENASEIVASGAEAAEYAVKVRSAVGTVESVIHALETCY